MTTSNSRSPWILPVEVFWGLETAVFLGVCFTPGAFAGMLISLGFLPTTVSYLRHQRTIGRVGRVWAILVIDAQALVVLAAPTYGGFDRRAWLIWVPFAVIAIGLGIGAWLTVDRAPRPFP